MGAARRNEGMTLLGMIITTVVVLVVIAVSFYLGKLFGYMKGLHEMMTSLGGIDVVQMVKKEMKEYFNGKSE